MADLRRTYRSVSSVVSPRGSGHISDLLGVVDLRGRDLRRACRRWDGFMWFGAIIFAAALAGAVATSIGALRHAAETGQWQDFFDTQILMVAVAAVQCCGPLIFVVVWPLARPTSRQLAAATLVLAQTASTRNATLAPVASDALAMLDHLPSADQSNIQMSLRRVNGTLATQSLTLGILALLCALGLGVVAVIAATNDPAVGSRQLLAAVFGASAIAASIVALMWLSDAVRLRGRVSVQADDLGLRWNQIFPRRRRVSVQWDEIRSIFLVDNLGGFRRRQACVVDADAAAIAFELASSASTDSDVDSSRLVKLALERTRRPLLNLSALAEEVSSRRNSAEYRRGYGQLADRLLLASLPRVRLPRPASPRRLALSVLLVFLPLTLVPTATLAGFAVQHAQEQEYTGLLTRARSRAPLYHDALTSADSDWPAHGPTTSDPNTYSFADGAYVITPPATRNPANAPFAEVYAPGTYRDAVVEVTMRMASGGVPYLTAGLALHALSGNIGNNLQFGIAGDGSWSVMHFSFCAPDSHDYSCGYFSDQGRDAIHHAAWAPNQLAAILHGSQVICFINGVYVGSLVDPDPHPGLLGIGIEGLDVSVEFSDFTIYPL